MKHWLLGLVAITVLSGCGSATIVSGSSPAPTATVTPTATPTPTPTATPAPVAAAVKTGASSLGTILTDSQGLTLYYLTPERGGHVACTGSCASNWPPLLLATGTATPVGAAGVPAKLGVVTRPDGSVQITFNSWPLYRFAGDAAPGDLKGQGIAGKWYAVTPSL